ncbi:MAG: family 1 glycosylhydrolase, partial [Pseudorhodobacter sp.]|nr:family 1 glycosylhydrolase [Frankiaceae bacterium]
VGRTADGAPEARDAVAALQNGQWLDALADGTSPDLLPVSPAVRVGVLELARGSADWVGVNYYTPFRIGAPRLAQAGAVGQDRDAFPGAPDFSFRPRPPLTTMGWEVDASGLVEVLREVAGRLPGLPLRVTENGGAFPDVAGTPDDDRIAYLRAHVQAVQQVVAEGVPVLDYLAWSLLDNFEWAQGYTQTFGLVAVEPGTLRRVPKASYDWYARWIADHP